MRITKRQLRRVIKEELHRSTSRRGGRKVPHGWSQILPWLTEDSVDEEGEFDTDAQDTWFSTGAENARLYGEADEDEGEYVSDDRSEKLMETANIAIEKILKKLWHDLYDEGFTGEGMGDAKLEELLERLMGNVKAGWIGEPR